MVLQIINRAKKTGEDPVNLSGRFCDEFSVDMASLQCLPPSVEPRMTGHISQIIQMVEKIISNGHAYVMEDGCVYFSVDRFPTYRQLSRRALGENRADLPEGSKACQMLTMRRLNAFWTMQRDVKFLCEIAWRLETALQTFQCWKLLVGHMQ